MPAITFDTLKFVEKLRSAGVPDAQAKAEAEALVEALAVAEVATKRDFEHLEAKLDSRFERLDGEIRLVKWMLALVVAVEAVPFMSKLFT